MRLPSIRSSPAGLPVTSGSPKTPSRSSRSWNASPSGSPNRLSWAICSGARPGQRGADVQRPLDGVLRRLVAQHRHRRVDVGRAARLRGDVEELAGDDLAAGQVEVAERVEHPLGGQAAGAQQLVGPAEQQVAEQDRGGGAVLLRARGPAALAVQLLERAVGGRPAAAYVGGVHVVVVHQRAGVQQLERGAGPQQRPARRPAGSATRVVAPPAERRPEPLAAGHAGARVLDQALRVGTERVEPGGLRGRRTSCSVDSMSARKPGSHSRPILRAARSPGERRPVSSAPCLRPRERNAVRIGDLLAQGGRSFSFEFFPPKDEAGEEVLWRSISELEPLRPDVRLGDLRRRGYDARPHHRDHRADRARDLDDADGAPHLRRPHHRGADPDPRLARRVRRAQRARAARRPARRPGHARGSRPRAGSTTPPTWSRSSARSATSRVGVAAFPEGHRDAASLDARRGRAARPSTTRAPSSRSPRWCCAPSDYFGLVERARAAGVDFPIIPGIMPILNFNSMAQDGRALRARDPRRGAGPDRAAQGRPGRRPRRGHRDRHRAVRRPCSTAARPACTSTR